MRAWSNLLKQSVVGIAAAASLINWPGQPAPIYQDTARGTTYSGPRPLRDNNPESPPYIPATSIESVARARESLRLLPRSFEANCGQAGSRVRFISRGDNFSLLISPAQALLSLGAGPGTGAGSAASSLRMRLIGANAAASTIPLDELPTRSNYFIGNNPETWLADLPSYARVKCRSVYPGIDLVYHGNDGQLEYDFIVAPRASYKPIMIRFEGADRISLNELGDVEIATTAGIVHHHRPVAYQEKHGVRRAIDARYIQKGSDIEFEIGAYDAREPLVIDPVLSYATYFGSRSGADSLNAVSFDEAGNSYVVGSTPAPDLPTTPGALQPAVRVSDVFIAKLNPAGTAVLYATYLGGSGVDEGASISVDKDGNAYVTGTTYSTDFPTTPNAFQRGPLGISSHPFAAKIITTGTALVYSTYLGTTGEEARGVSVAVDVAGQATVAGLTDSARFPTTANALQPLSGGSDDAFVARLTHDGSGLVFSTYLGGEDYDAPICLAVDGAGNTYVAGHTFSTRFPTTRHAYQREKKGFAGSFVGKINPAGDRLVYSTFIGGGDLQVIKGIAIDSSGNAYVTGFTSARDFPTTPGVVQPVSGGDYDAIVVKLNDTGRELVYSTLIGGSGTDVGNAIAVDSLGQAYVAGNTTSADFPLARPLQARKFGGPLFRSMDSGVSWEDISPNVPGFTSLVVDHQVSSVLYATSSGNIIKSTDSGATWRVITLGVSGSLVIDPLRSEILYVVQSRRISKSTDAGNNWFSVDLSSGSNGFAALVVDPKTPDTLYVSTQQLAVPTSAERISDVLSGVLFKSTDAGTSWATLDFGQSVLSVSCLAIDPAVTSTLYAGVESPASNLYKSTDGGAHWSSSASGVRRVVIDPTDSATLYAVDFIGRVLKSTNGGVFWSPTGFQKIGLNSLAIDPQAPSTLYSSNFNGVYRTTDGGESWQAALDRVFVGGITLDPQHSSIVFVTAANTTDCFVAKINSTGTAFIYSTYLGGIAQDSAVSIAADAYGNAFVGGISNSPDFPVTPGAYQTIAAKSFTGIVVRIADPVSPRIESVSSKGKKLVVSGEGFDRGAVITMNGADLPTENDTATPSIRLISRRGAKQAGRGQTVAIRVRNFDGRLSNEVNFTR